jgi:hypothetical protein
MTGDGKIVSELGSRALALVGGSGFFALPDLVFLMDVVRDQTTARAHSSADDRAGRAANLGADERSAYGSAGDELGLGMVMPVVAMGLDDGIFMGFLRENRQRHGQNSSGYSVTCKLEEFHFTSSCGPYFYRLQEGGMRALSAPAVPNKDISRATLVRNCKTV